MGYIDHDRAISEDRTITYLFWSIIKKDCEIELVCEPAISRKEADENLLWYIRDEEMSSRSFCIEIIEAFGIQDSQTLSKIFGNGDDDNLALLGYTRNVNNKNIDLSSHDFITDASKFVRLLHAQQV